DSRFARNRARADLMPAFEGLHARAIETLTRTAQLAAADDRLLDALALTDLAARRSADGWVAWAPPPPAAVAARLLRAASGVPAPSKEGTEALRAAANEGRGGGVIELGGGRSATLRSGRVRILHST